jgi:hypothetical protein
MIRRAALALAALALIVPTTAQASTEVDAPCPTPTVAQELGCYVPNTDTIYVDADLDRVTHRAVLLHERGHAFSALHLDDAERAAISAERGWSRWLEENFAELYAGCHMSTRLRHRAFPFAVWGRDPKLCALIRRAA